MAKPKKRSKKPTPKKKPNRCRKCGASTGGKGTICLACASTELSANKVAQGVKERLRRGDTDGPVCPFCRTALDWQNCKVVEYEVSIYVREKIYYCPNCRAFLGVSSWHSEG